jgi:hypothetical protein
VQAASSSSSNSVERCCVQLRGCCYVAGTVSAFEYRWRESTAQVYS